MIEREVFAKNQMLKHLRTIQDSEFLEKADSVYIRLSSEGIATTSKKEAVDIGDGVKDLIKDLQHFDKFLGEVRSL